MVEVFFYYYYYYWKTIFFLMKGEEKPEYMRWQGSSVLSHTSMLAYDFFFTFWFCFLSHRAGWQFFFCSFLFVYSIVYATSLITNLGEQYSLAFVDKKKKAKRWPCYSGEWKQARQIFVFIIRCVFRVEALALRNKKEVEGRRDRERERERRYFQKKRGGGE